MKFFDFKHQMNRMIEVYGEKAYNKERMDQIWRLVEDLDSRDFERIVSQLIMENYSAPMGNKFRELTEAPLRVVRERRASQLQELADKERCDKCNSTGIVSAWHREMKAHPYSFRCGFCDVSNMLGLSDKIPLWSESLYKVYYPAYDLDEYSVSPKEKPRPVEQVVNSVIKKIEPTDENFVDQF